MLISSVHLKEGSPLRQKSLQGGRIVHRTFIKLTMCLAPCNNKKSLTSRTFWSNGGEQHLLYVETNDMIKLSEVLREFKRGTLSISLCGGGFVKEKLMSRRRPKI